MSQILTRPLFPLFILTGSLSASDLITVTSKEDSGPGSLRQAITDINPSGTIQFDLAPTEENPEPKITLTTGQLLVSKTVTIDGSGLAIQPIISANGNSRVIQIAPEGDLTLESVTISDGTADAGSGILNNGKLSLVNATITMNTAGSHGGGIFIGTSASLTMTGSTISENEALKDGAGIYNYGILNATGSTFTANKGGRDGGGLMVRGTLTLNASLFESNEAEEGGGIYILRDSLITGCTFTENMAETKGGGVRAIRDLTLQSCTITGNTAPKGGGVYATNDSPVFRSSIIASNGESNVDGYRPKSSNSLTGDTSPSLRELGDYGGLTRTMPPTAESTAVIDLGVPGSMEFTDARGAVRISGAAADIGAVEFWGGVVENLDLTSTDPDQDGTSTLLETALGRNPYVPDSNSTLNFQVKETTPVPSLTFGINPNYTERFIIRVFRSTDLTNFDEMIASNESVPFSTSTEANLVEIIDSANTGRTQAFYRIQVEER